MEGQKLFEALCKAQSELKPAALDMVNPHYKSKYASLSSVMEAIKTPLAKNGLSFIQCVENEGEAYYLKTILAHASGEKIESRVQLILGRRDMQGLGSSITYARRYSLSAMLGVVDTDDDDGNASLPETPKTKPKAPVKRDPPAFNPDELFHPSSKDELLSELYSLVDAKGIDPVIVSEMIFEMTGEKIKSNQLTEAQILKLLKKLS